jgi:nicotinamidase-related amidase
MANAIIVVDMQNGFMRPDGTLYCGDQAREIIPRIVARVQGERDAGAALFFTQDSHVKNDKEFEMFPPHCIEGSEEEQLIDELAPLAEDAHIIKKRRYSAFFETELAGALDELWPDKVVVMGDCTDICVLHTVSGLRNRDYAVEVPADCVASFDSEQHHWALGHMEKILGARITNR